METLKLAMLALSWLCANTEYEKCQEVDIPQISWHYNSQLNYILFKRITTNNNNLFIQAIYLNDINRILINKELKNNIIELQTTLIHELYHKLQYINNDINKCLAAMEPAAYKITDKFAKQSGLPHKIPVEVFMFASLCNSPYDEMID